MPSHDHGERPAGLRGLHARLERIVARLEDAAAIGAGIAMLVIVLLVSVDVVMRYAFASPLTFQFHLVKFYLLVALVMLALPWGYRNGGAIQIQLLFAMVSRRVSGPIQRIGLAAASVYLFVLAYEGWEGFVDAYVGDRVVMGVIDWPVAWSWVFVPVGCGLLALRVLLDACAPELREIGAHD